MPAALACASHVDSVVFTSLYEDGGGGLRVRDRGGAWRDVPFDPDAIVVNTGLALQRLSGGALTAPDATPSYEDFLREAMGRFAECAREA